MSRATGGNHDTKQSLDYVLITGLSRSPSSMQQCPYVRSHYRLYFPQTQEVQKAMDEKRFEDAVKLRGRYDKSKGAKSSFTLERLQMGP